MSGRILPVLTEENDFFWTSGADGRLRFLRCTDCRSIVHPPAPVCPQCWSRTLAPSPVSGRGTVASFTVNHHPWLPGYDPPYVVALVEIEEDQGVRVMTNIVECAPEDVSIGMAVEVMFEHHEDVWLPLFRPGPES